MREELYIKGEPVDLGDSEIALNFKSNLLGDISEITASNSYTIELPRTMRNTRLLEFPDVAAHESYMMRDYFDAEYWRNGIKLFDAKAVLESCNEDSYSIILTWGIDERLITLVNDNKSIQEFADMALPWNASTTYDNGNDNGTLTHGYIPHNSGIDVDSHRDIIFVHPAANCMRILEDIAEYYNLPMDWGSYKNYIELLYLPLISQKADPKYNKFSVLLNKTRIDFSYILSQFNIISGAEFYGGSTADPDSIIISNTNIDWILEVSFKTIVDTPGAYLNISFEDKNRNRIYVLKIEADKSGLHYYKNKIPFNITKYDFIRIAIYAGGDIGIDYNSNNIISLINEDINENIKYGTYYPIGTNLPDIKVVDFIKNMCWLFGLFAEKSDTGVRFIPVSQLSTNKTKAVDWSRKLAPTGWTAKETTYSFGDYAQKNWLRYEENENAKSADDYLSVEDRTLDNEKDLIKMSFTAGGDNGDMRAVPYFKWNDDGENIDLVDCGDRIMQLVIKFDGPAGREDVRLEFTDLKFQNRISRFGLSYYQDIIKYPFVIKDDFRLTDIDLRSLDMTVPVYIEQYGAYFAIISIKSQGEISEVELLKLK